MKKILSIIVLAMAVALVSVSCNKVESELTGTEWSSQLAPDMVLTLKFISAETATISDGEDTFECSYTFVKPTITLMPPKGVKDQPLVGTLSGNTIIFGRGDEVIAFKKVTG